ncbi:unnamed protein product, partial [Clonostachys rosea]
FLNEVWSRRGSAARQRLGASDNSSPRTNITSKSATTADQAELASLLNHVVLPPRQVADAHLNNYWKHFYPFNPILHQASFQKRYLNLPITVILMFMLMRCGARYEEVWTGRVNHDAVEISVHSVRAFHALLNIIMALGCLFPQLDDKNSITKTNGGIFLERSQQLQLQASLDHASLTLVQANALTAQYLSTTGMVNRCWVTLGVAIRTAQGIGIHLDLPSESQAQRQERRRTWWYCVQMDRVTGMVYGRPPMVLWPTGVPHPDIVDDNALSTEPCSAAYPIQSVQISEQSYFIHSLQLSDILLDILNADKSLSRDKHLVNQDCNQLVELDSQLAKWKCQLPEILSFDPQADISGDGPFRREATFLYSRFLHLRILLFRPFIINLARKTCSEGDSLLWTDFQYSVVSGCAKACISAAQELISVLHKRCMSTDGRPSHWWFAVFYLFTAGTVILAFKSSPKLRALQTDANGQMERSWAMAIEILSIFERHGNVFARRCLWILATSLNQISQASPDRASEEADKGPPGGSPGPNEGLQHSGTHDSTDILPGDESIVDRLWSATSLDWLNGIPELDETENEAMMTFNDMYTEGPNM